MNIREQLLVEMSRSHMEYIANTIEAEPHQINWLFQLCLKNEPKVSLRAAWVLSILGDRRSTVLLPYVPDMIQSIELLSHQGIHRLFLRYLADIYIPDEWQGKIYDLCFRWLVSSAEPIAVKIHCMQILFNIAQKEPELKRELLLVLEDLASHESAGIRNRCLKLTSKLY